VKNHILTSPRAGAVLLIGALLVCLCGCPIDTNTVFTETLRAGLSSAVNSFIDKLAQFLAGT
jgi:hypothetical protein